MTNYEKYADIINNFKGTGNFCEEFVEPYILKISDCYDAGVHCGACHLRQAAWLFEECKESAVDWSEVEVDTPILVRDSENQEWIRRHFAKHKNGSVYTWCEGLTSWTAPYDDDVTRWKYAKLPEDKE